MKNIFILAATLVISYSGNNAFAGGGGTGDISVKKRTEIFCRDLSVPERHSRRRLSFYRISTADPILSYRLEGATYAYDTSSTFTQSVTGELNFTQMHNTPGDVVRIKFDVASSTAIVNVFPVNGTQVTYNMNCSATRVVDASHVFTVSVKDALEHILTTDIWKD